MKRGLRWYAESFALVAGFTAAWAFERYVLGHDVKLWIWPKRGW